METDFCFNTGERFADVALLRYRLDGFEKLSFRQKRLVYCLAKATLYGRDITFDQFGAYNLKIRKTLEAIYTTEGIDHETDDFKALEQYLKRVWFSNGIYHHYGSEKLVPDFTPQYFLAVIQQVDHKRLPLEEGQTADSLGEELVAVMFGDNVPAMKVNRKDGDDLVMTSAVNFYEGVTQQEAEQFYAEKKKTDWEPIDSNPGPPSWGLNSKLVKRNGKLCEEVWCLEGRYAEAISQIVYWLQKAMVFAEGPRQLYCLEKLVDYYTTGNLDFFNKYCVAWVGDTRLGVDFINGFIEVYDDPLGLKGTWEGLVEYRDVEGTKRTRIISNNAQWFEDHSPVDERFKKSNVEGVSAHVVRAAMLGGAEYPSTAIGINLPNADWLRAELGSKSVTISNIIQAYNEVARGNGFDEEFVIDEPTRQLIRKYGNLCDTIHTDLHECLGHGSGQLLPGVDPDALKAYGNTIEEARADLFGLYYAADPKLVELGLLDSEEAYQATYYCYMMNGLLTQLARIKRGNTIEEAHMRNRALIAHWCYEKGKENKVVELVKKAGKTYVQVNDYVALRQLFAQLLAEVQRIKSEGDLTAARELVERYAVQVDKDIHEEILQRYEALGIPPYKGFVNPRLYEVYDSWGSLSDIGIDYTESYAQQMLRYSEEYATLI